MTAYFEQVEPDDVVLVRLLEQRAAKDPGRVFFTFADRSYTRGDFNAGVNQMARNLLSIGIGEGSRVGILMDSSPEYLTLWFALGKVGAVEVPINTAYHGEMLRHQLSVSGATCCIVDAHYLPALQAITRSLPLLQRIVVRSSESADESGSDHLDFAALTADNARDNLDNVIAHDSLAGIIFTSGTTGPSKGVLLTHHYLAAYGYMYADINALAADDVLLNFLPYFHMGAKFLTIATLVCGGQMRLVPRLSISTFMDEVHRHSVTNFVGVGGICNMLLSRPREAGDAKSTIRTIYAVPDPTDMHAELEQRFNCSITTVYGSTEVGLPIVRGVGSEYRPGSCGRKSSYYDVIVVDEHDNELPNGIPGEIVVRPRRPYLIGSGYVGMDPATVDAWRNLWLHSGDRGHVDDEGYFFFQDRKSDSIRRRGENISSFEVEMFVGQHPAVAEAVAVAAPSPIGEDDVWVLVILRPGSDVTPEELLIHCADVMPYFMIPRYIDVVDDFPRTPTAKVEKYRLRGSGPSPTTWDREQHGWKLTRTGLHRPPQFSDGPDAARLLP